MTGYPDQVPGEIRYPSHLYQIHINHKKTIHTLKILLLFIVGTNYMKISECYNEKVLKLSGKYSQLILKNECVVP